MGDYRIILVFRVVEQIAIFELLLSRGEVYRKLHETNLRKKEKD